MPLTLEIVTPERRVLETTCDEVRAPGAAGGFGIRPGHAGFMSALDPGELTVVTGGREERYAIGGGLLQVDRDRAIVLADTAEPAAEIDVDRAQRAFNDANQKLLAVAADQQAYRQEAARVRRAAARLSVARK